MMHLCSLFLILLVSTQAIASRPSRSFSAGLDKIADITVQPSMLRWIRGEALAEVQDEKLREILTEIGLSVEEFEQTLSGYAAILSRLGWSEGEITRQDLLASIAPTFTAFGNHLDHLIINQVPLTDVDRRVTIIEKMLALVEETAHSPRMWGWGKRIGLDADRLVRVMLHGNGLLHDFVYMRYAIGEEPKLQTLFDALLTENGLSREAFDIFFANNKNKYADLHRRKDIIDRMLGAVRTSSKEKRTELLAKIGLHDSGYDDYVHKGRDDYVHKGKDLLNILLSIQAAIGADTKLNSIFDELLLEQDTTRQALEQAITDVTAVFSTVWQMHYPEQEITRELALKMISTAHVFHSGKGYFNALITGDKSVFPPAKAEKISSIFREMLTVKASTQKDVDYRLRELVIYNFKEFVTSNPSHFELSYVKYALGEDQKKQELFNALLEEYGFSEEELATQYNHNHPKIHRRKDIVDRMLAVVRTSPEQKRSELLAKIGLNELMYLSNINDPHTLMAQRLIKMQIAIGDDAKLNVLFDELLEELGVGRQKFEQAISDTAAFYYILFDRNSPKREMPPRQLVLENMHKAWGGLLPPHFQHNDRRTMFMSLPSPSVVVEIVSVLKDMLENVRTSAEQTTTQLMKEIGLSDDALRFFVRRWSAYVLLFPMHTEHHDKIILAGHLADMQRAIGENAELNAQLDKLMALLNVSRQEMALENIVAE